MQLNGSLYVNAMISMFQDRTRTYLISVDYNLALLFVTASDQEEVVERRRVVQDALVLKRV